MDPKKTTAKKAWASVSLFTLYINTVCVADGFQLVDLHTCLMM